MQAESLLASAGINIGLALVIFTLFSVLKKQPLLPLFTSPVGWPPAKRYPSTAISPSDGFAPRCRGSLLLSASRRKMSSARAALTHLSSSASLNLGKSGFFITYILTDGLSGFSLELLQLGLILWHFIRSPFEGDTIKDHYLFGFPYYRVIPTVSLAILIGMVYAVIAPLLLPFIITYFLVGYAVYVDQVSSS